MLSTTWLITTCLSVTAQVPTAPVESPLPPPVPWEVVETSTTPTDDPAPVQTVSARLFEKASHVMVRAGVSYLAREDFYRNPGISVDASWYMFETLSFDLSTTAFFSSLGVAADTLRRNNGLLPDAQRPVFRATAGSRYAFLYGKALIEPLDVILHLDLSLGAHLGALVTDKTVNFAGDFDLGLQILVGKQALIWMQAVWFYSYENRLESSFTGGPMGTLGVGVKL